MMGIMTFFPLGFLPGYFIAWGLRKLDLLRVPPEVELEGLDQAEFERDFYPEFERVDEVMVDATAIPCAPIRSCVPRTKNSSETNGGTGARR